MRVNAFKLILSFSLSEIPVQESSQAFDISKLGKRAAKPNHVWKREDQSLPYCKHIESGISIGTSKPSCWK